MRVGGTVGFPQLRRSGRARLRSLTAILANGLSIGVLAAGLTAASLTTRPAAAADSAARWPDRNRLLSGQESAIAQSAFDSQPVTDRGPVRTKFKRADFDGERASRQSRRVADWVVDSGDNAGLPFVIVDKIDAKVFVFDSGGQLRGAAPALLGMARGDDAVPGIGDRPLSTIRPEERTTPAGRFVAALGLNMREDVLWVDYEGAVSMHRVIATNPGDRRLERLATPTPHDNRISYGCINVPVKFYEGVVRPAFTGTNGIVYVLPETRSARAVFGSYDLR